MIGRVYFIITVVLILLVTLTLISTNVVVVGQGRSGVAMVANLDIEAEMNYDNFEPIVKRDPIRSAYERMKLNGVIDYNAFKLAMSGYNKLSPKRKIITLIDYTKPSTERRLYVLDVVKGRLLHRSYVSHGRGSGDNYAKSFSNVSGSHQSSLGFFITGETYQGANGYSMFLDGIEGGVNDRARERYIVMHGAGYCDPLWIGKQGRLGRSLGCPALPMDVSKEIIDDIKDGSLLFIYGDSEEYVRNSCILPRIEQ